jgi:hypothetical protein
MDIVNSNYAVSILAIYTPNLSWNYDGRIYEIIIKNYDKHLLLLQRNKTHCSASKLM